MASEEQPTISQTTPPQQGGPMFYNLGDAQAAVADIRLNVGVYGETKTGKSYFAASFPGKVMYFTLAQDRGVEMLKLHPNRAALMPYPLPQPTAPGAPRRSIVDDLVDGLWWLRNNYERYGVKTMVFDHATGFGEAMASEYSNYGLETMPRQKWGLLRQNFLNIVQMTADLPIHCVWVFHNEDQMSGSIVTARSPRLIGHTLEKDLDGTFNLWCYCDKTAVEETIETDGGKTMTRHRNVHRLWTKCPEGVLPPFKVGSHYEQFLDEAVYHNDFRHLDAKFGGRLLK